MTTAIAKYQPQTLPEIMEVGKILASSGFFSDAGGAAQAVAKIIAGQELGFGPMAALTGIYIVNGRVTLSANLMAAAIKRSGKYNYRVTALTDQEVVIEFSERMDGKWTTIGVSSLTMKEARAAELHMEWDKKESKWREKATWKKFPKNMLFARALSNGAKWYTPDIMGGPLYTPDEFDLPTDEDGVVIEGGYTPSVIIEDQPAPAPEVPADPPAQPRSNGKATKPAKATNPGPRWNDDPDLLAANEKYYTGLGLTGLDALDALDADEFARTGGSVRSFTDYTGDRPQAKAAYAIYIDAKIKAEQIADAEQPALLDDQDADKAASNYTEGA